MKFQDHKLRANRWVFFALLLCLSIGLYSCSSSKPEKRTYTIARDLTWYPLDFMGKDSNMLGFIDDLIIAVGKETDLDINLAFTTSNAMMNGLNSGLYDGVVTSLMPTSITKLEYNFSEPLMRVGAVLVVHQDSDIRKLIELEEKEIGIDRGSAAAFDTVRFPSVTIVPYENNMDALEDLSQHAVDGVIMQVIPASIYINSFFKDELKVATQPLTDLALRVVMKSNKGNQKFLKVFDEGITAIKESGLYDALIKKWGLFNPESVEQEVEIEM